MNQTLQQELYSSTQGTVTISNGQYNISTIQHKLQPAKVTGLTVPAGWKVVRLDFELQHNVHSAAQ
ncbi:hypothetical protein [Caldicellulosiruptor bescii]|uniref:Uncharacterized protein n=1 Tax=Caldicellulosiruptor bescii (strain ATCC BAA-1888 / DSM 6725 / KCTC 15123 / Z-1320) TaxID=521460 RepID=B9MPR3_CALBD|nr:hypothetical protein [Caldicellulosiruptor bescii]ACM61696.1 hypothetical protein Athe_2631 [Caldicellulosiruptor bescii DSM 6725]PBD07761.1 hypothetical protein B0S84_0026 [Caldicellulosiruptor bescii]SKC65727.1 hypothetical protein SAMN04515608_2827 [Caldicellulosiruptor bescii]SMR88666.1 hypothetical protein SAMN04515609_0555 [Caldicellulosiruptor bescii]